MPTRSEKDIGGIDDRVATVEQNVRNGDVYIKSPNGHYWKVTVSDLGVPGYTDIGESLPDAL